MTQIDFARRLSSSFVDTRTEEAVQYRKLDALHRSNSASSASAQSVSPSIETHDCAALVIGCGVAGNAAALRLANAGVKVTVISAADDPHESATYYAQGGIIYKSHDDSPDLLAMDVHRAGAGVCDDAAVQKLAIDGPGRVEEMLLKVSKTPFTCDDKGELALTLEASHNRARILYKDDQSGKAITESMVAAVRMHDNITLLNGRSAFEVVTNAKGHCVGALTVTSTGKVERFNAPFTLLATGGVGDVYENTSNPDGARGEGIALAMRAGAKLKNMQYVQFHPTTLFIPNERRFLLTEALRGEGAILRDRSGRAFAKDYHPDGELAPRDVVARTILAEMAKQNEPCMFLDISHEDASWIRSRFPTIYARCLQFGYDMTTQAVPVVPAAHYHCGGVEVDLNGCTSVKGLYAAGEVSCTGLHGANRLASTSLLEGLVWGCGAADHFLGSHDDDEDEVEGEPPAVDFPTEGKDANEAALKEVMLATQRIMWEGVGPLRTMKGLQSAVDKLELLEAKAESLYRECTVSRQSSGLRNAVIAAKAIALAALNSPVSVGTHQILADSE